jgi:hypothetical protein
VRDVVALYEYAQALDFSLEEVWKQAPEVPF